MFPILERASRNDLITHLSQRGFCTNCMICGAEICEAIRRFKSSQFFTDADRNSAGPRVAIVRPKEKIRTASSRHAAASAQAGVLSIHRNRNFDSGKMTQYMDYHCKHIIPIIEV